MSDKPYVYKKYTFLASLALGLSAVAIAALVCGTIVTVYGIHFVGSQSDRFIQLTDGVIDGIPEVIESLPPLASDLLNDQRSPDYCSKIEATARVVADQGRDCRPRIQVEVANSGQSMVTLLSMRLLVLDANDNIVSESNQWAATPLAVDREWPGPIMPNSNRSFTCCVYPVYHAQVQGDVHVEVEITDLRTWAAKEKAPAADQVSIVAEAGQ